MPHHVDYHAEFDHSMSNCVGASRVGLKKNLGAVGPQPQGFGGMGCNMFLP